MALTVEQFEQLTQLLSTPLSWRRSRVSFDAADRRDSVRFPARGPAELHLAPPDGAARAVTVYVHEVSPAGMGLFSGTPLSAGVAVRVVLTNGHDDVAVRCSVRHCTILAAGFYGVGVNVDDYDTRATPPAPPGDDAAAAWYGYFAGQVAATSKGVKE